MTEYIDCFGRKTIIDIKPPTFNDKVTFIVRKERQVFADAWDIETAKKILNELQQSIEAK